VIDLDDAAVRRAADPSDMLGIVASSPTQIREGYALGRAVDAPPSIDGVRCVTYLGMGGSAVAGDVLRAAFRGGLHVPVEVNRHRELPAHVGPDTLVVACSYSGDTSETLAAFEAAADRRARLLVVTSGGTLEARARETAASVVRVPGGGQPRGALGHLTFAMLGALEVAGLLPALGDEVDETVSTLEAVFSEMGPDVPAPGNAAKDLAAWIGDRVAVIWGAEGLGAVAAMRWKTQLNENGKIPAWHSAMSELDHNEVVGWVPPYGERHAIVALRQPGEHPEMAARFALSAPIAEASGAMVREVMARGDGPLARLFSLIVVGDLVSCFVGLRRGRDPTPVDVLVRLKAALARPL